MTEPLTLKNAHAHLSLQVAGGMIGPLTATLGERSGIEVLTSPGWADAPGAEDWLPLIRHLNGDFVGLPYGAPEPNLDLPATWRAGARARARRWTRCSTARR